MLLIEKKLKDYMYKSITESYHDHEHIVSDCGHGGRPQPQRPQSSAMAMAINYNYIEM